MRLPGLVLALTLVALPVQAQASEALWSLLKACGQVVIMRHAATDQSLPDSARPRLDDCNTQRNLSAAGREDAQRIGAAFTARRIAVDGVRSSPWCRCVDTARLAFGSVEVWSQLNSVFRDRSQEPAQMRAVREMVSSHRGGTLVFVTHQVNITALTGLYPGEGEMIILTPQSDGFTVAGRLKPSDVTAN